MPEIDFDLNESDLRIGVELEWPLLDEGKPLVNRGYYSDGLRNEVGHVPPRYEADSVYDGTVGMELVSVPLDVADVENWTAEIIDYVEQEYNAGYQPVGLLENGNTAGAHVHISPLTEQKARRLAELSEEPWMRVLFCSSIAIDGDGSATWPVFRGGDYCRPGYADGHRAHGDSHYTCVNRRSDDHFEWRMPEPVSPENFGVLARFLALFKYDEDVAIEYAQELLDSGSDKLTSIKRAEKVGMDIEDVPDIRREPHPETEDFFSAVRSASFLPEIYLAIVDGRQYYVLDSRLDFETSVNGYGFHTQDVLFADTAEPVSEEEAEEVRRTYNRVAQIFRETEATKELKKIVKKKKGVANA